jgi:hypothetical protein
VIKNTYLKLNLGDFFRNSVNRNTIICEWTFASTVGDDTRSSNLLMRVIIVKNLLQSVIKELL